MSINNVGFWRRSTRKLLVLLAGTTVFQTSGCQIDSVSEIIATWGAAVVGDFVTTYVNGVFNVPSSSLF